MALKLWGMIVHALESKVGVAQIGSGPETVGNCRTCIGDFNGEKGDCSLNRKKCDQTETGSGTMGNDRRRTGLD